MSKQDKILQRRKESEPNPTLDDILNRKVLDRHLGSGIVKCDTHDTLPLYLYDYSTLCERRWSWDGVTILTRGLIRDNKGIVIGRPLQKFFSRGGKSTSAVPAPRWNEYWYALEKVDGSMIVAANYKGELVLSTRGSFHSKQIAMAQAIWPKGALPVEGTTWVLEYVGPDNKIVVDYDEPALYLLAVVDNWSGVDKGTAEEIAEEVGLETPKRIEAETLEELMEQGPDDGTQEGWVLVWPRDKKPSPRLKVKYPAYLKRHLEIFNSSNE